ncbi:MAG: ribosome maturation factor RimM [Gammaproteobacteria bacterium]|nr:ribosome maturation factor RimM [Gammaproteobacteria bacterium]
MDKPIVLGRISGLYGVKGWVKVFSYTDPREALLDYRECFIGRSGRWEPTTIAEGRRHGKTVVARLEPVQDRDAAAELIGADLAVPRSGLPEPPEGEYYWADLEGLRVVHKDGRELGTVSSLLTTGAHDVLVVAGDNEILVPFVPGRTVLDVDLGEGLIQVDWEWD